MDGVTHTERKLNSLCKRNFMSLWSYPAIYRNQGGIKEICDSFIIFGNDIVIFSDKDCDFPTNLPIEKAWARWYKRAIEKSANQAFGAERWIKNFPDRLFVDKDCTSLFPLPIKITLETKIGSGSICKNVIFQRRLRSS